MVYSQDEIKQLGSILGVWAHPDDEAWSSAGLMKMAYVNGQRVGVVTATKGDAGQTADALRWAVADLATIRMQELSNSLACIGDVQQYWLDYEDGKLNLVDKHQIAQQIALIIDEFQPDTIITFESNGVTGHDDHKTISQIASLAASLTDQKCRVLHAIESWEKYQEAGYELDREFNFFFNTEKPVLVHEKEADIVIKLPPDILECKMCCLKAHASQTSQLFLDKKHTQLVRVMAQTECYVSS